MRKLKNKKVRIIVLIILIIFAINIRQVYVDVYHKSWMEHAESRTRPLLLLIYGYHYDHGVFPTSIEDIKREDINTPYVSDVISLLNNTNEFRDKFVCSSNGEVVITITKPAKLLSREKKLVKKFKIPDDVEKDWKR